MPPTGVKSAKRARQYEHIKESELKEGRSTKRAKQIAAATVNKQRREKGETNGTRKTSSRKTSGAKKTSSRSRKSASSSRSRKSASRTSSGSKKK